MHVARNLFALMLVAFVAGCGPSVVGRAPLTTGKSVDIVQIPLRLANVFLIQTRWPTLVDTGTIGDMDDLVQALADRGFSITAIKLAIITHGHADHAGLAADIQHGSHAIIVLGAADVPLAAIGHNDEMKPTGAQGTLLKPFITTIYPTFSPDIALPVGESLDLARWGISGKVIAMPGHTAGSIVVVLDDHTAFVGDMIAGGALGGIFAPHSPNGHLFQADPEQNRKNIQTLLDLGIRKFYLGHGGPVSREDVITKLGMH